MGAQVATTLQPASRDTLINNDNCDAHWTLSFSSGSCDADLCQKRAAGNQVS